MTKNSRAPFTGILVPEDTYRRMAADASKKSEFEKIVEDCSVENFSVREDATKSTTLWFGAGAALGVVLAIALRK